MQICWGSIQDMRKGKHRRTMTDTEHVGLTSYEAFTTEREEEWGAGREMGEEAVQCTVSHDMLEFDGICLYLESRSGESNSCVEEIIRIKQWIV
ncbi:hypothetical protein STEG23_014153 [Scotinomys teguina]